MAVLMGFFFTVYIVAAHRQHERLGFRFRWLFVSAVLVAASLYSLRILL